MTVRCAAPRDLHADLHVAQMALQAPRLRSVTAALRVQLCDLGAQRILRRDDVHHLLYRDDVLQRAPLKGRLAVYVAS